MEKKDSFYRRFFLMAQKLLPRHVLRELLTQTAEKPMDDDLNLKDLSPEELALLLRPILQDLVNRLGEEKARAIFKEAVSRHGLNPDEFDFSTAGSEPDPENPS